MNSADVITAMMARLDGAALGYDIAWPDIESDFQPPYLAVDLFLADPERLGSTTVHRTRGLMSVSVVTKEGSGAVAALRIAEQVKAVFSETTQFAGGSTSIRIYRTPTISRGLNDGGAYRTPVTIPFETIE